MAVAYDFAPGTTLFQSDLNSEVPFSMVGVNALVSIVDKVCANRSTLGIMPEACSRTLS